MTDEEKTFLAEHASELTDEQAKEFDIEKEAKGSKELDEELDKEGLTELINLTVEQKVQEVVAKLIKVKRGELKTASDVLPANGKWTQKTVDWCVALTDGDLAQMKALTTADDDTPKAGYTVPVELFNEIVRLIQGDPIYGIARKEMRYLPFVGSGNPRDITKS